jgi:hypothetical protein
MIEGEKLLAAIATSVMSSIDDVLSGWDIAIRAGGC